MQKYNLLFVTMMAAALAACSHNEPVKVVNGDKTIDYSQNKNIHISESNVQPQPAVQPVAQPKPAEAKLTAVKPKNATALCIDGSYSLDTQNPCAKAGGVKEKLQHYHAD